MLTQVRSITSSDRSFAEAHRLRKTSTVGVAELQHRKAPPSVRSWAGSLPSWVKVCDPRRVDVLEGISVTDQKVVALAVEMNELLLIDDNLARHHARHLGVPTIGTVGLLEAASTRDLIDLSESFRRLRETSFFVSEEILQDALRRDSIRRSRKPGA